ncbi:MAG: amidohydrolase family protein [Chitinophagales bacterium]
MKISSRFSYFSLMIMIGLVSCHHQIKEERRIIDTHYHALKWNSFGDLPPPNDITGIIPIARTDSQEEAVMINALEKNHIVMAFTSGRPKRVDQYKLAAKDRIMEGLLIENESEIPDTASFVRMISEGRLKVCGELSLPYFGIILTDPIFEPYLAICERNHIPVALHTGISFPNTPYICCPQFRTRLGNPQLIEDALVKHPKLKVQLMHMGYPFFAETKAILDVYPQVYVDIATVDWLVNKADFYNYLKPLIDAGFEKRVMFGSDCMVWDDAISLAIKNIEQAPFLSEVEKQDIFYNNAAKFFDLH